MVENAGQQDMTEAEKVIAQGFKSLRTTWQATRQPFSGKTLDPDLLILKQVKAEYATLR
jgi:hypothetical protein